MDNSLRDVVLISSLTGSGTDGKIVEPCFNMRSSLKNPYRNLVTFDHLSMTNDQAENITITVALTLVISRTPFLIRFDNSIFQTI